MRIFLCIFILLLTISCRDECLYDECSAYLGEAKVIFKPGTVYGPGEVLRGLFQPTVVSTSNGELFVFAQGRVNSSEDNEDKVLIMSKSDDRGQTWTQIEFLTVPASFWGVTAFISKNPSGNEVINAMMTYSKPKMFERYSDEELMEHFNIDAGDYDEEDASILFQVRSFDGGNSWERRVASENFLSTFHANGDYVAFFSPVGQTNRIKEGPHTGRLIAGGPVKHQAEIISNPDDIYDYPGSTSTMIYSDDEGETWQMGGIAPHGGNEASVAAIENGETIMMIRRRNGDYPGVKRIANYSYDQGMTWTDNEDIPDLASPKCLGVLYDDKEMLMYTTPKHDSRTQGWAGYSIDEGQTWQGKVIEPGLFSYSDITRIEGTDSYCVAYSLLHHGELGLAVRVFNKGWLID